MEFERQMMRLINAINDEDLATTMECVDIINQLEYSDQILTSILRFNFNYQNYTNYFTNVCIDYVLKHLKGINMVGQISFIRDKNKLSIEADPKVIKDFILNQLENKTYDITDKELVQGLIELAVQMNDRQQTADIFTKILERFDGEVL